MKTDRIGEKGGGGIGASVEIVLLFLSDEELDCAGNVEAHSRIVVGATTKWRAR